MGIEQKQQQVNGEKEDRLSKVQRAAEGGGQRGSAGATGRVK